MYETNDVYKMIHVEFYIYHLMCYHDKLSYHDKNILIIDIVVNHLSHTTTILVYNINTCVYQYQQTKIILL